MSYHTTIINQNLQLTPSLYGSTITLHAPENVSSVRTTAATVTVSGATFIDGSTSKTTTGYITVGPVPYHSNLWNIVDIFPYSNDFPNVDIITTPYINIRSNMYLTGHAEVARYISVFGTLLTENLTQQGNPCISDSNLVSTVIGLSNIYILSTSSYVVSTISGLGTSSYISSTQLQSTVNNLGQFRYISQASLTSTFVNQNIYISSNDLVSTTAGLGSKYISTLGLISTVVGLGTLGYVSSATIDLDVLSNSFIQGNVQNLLIPMVSGLSQGSNGGYISTIQLVSTVQGLGRIGYISTIDFVSGVQSINNSNIISTVSGLGSRYYSTNSIISTVNSLSNNFTSNLVSLYANLGNNYISTPSLFSTVQGLGSKYISTASLTSTFAGFESYSLINFVNNLGSNYISTPSLTSTTTSLLKGFSNLVTVTVNNLPTQYTTTNSLVSTVIGLGTAGYISTASLISSFNSWSFLNPTWSDTILNMETKLPYMSTPNLVSCNILVIDSQLEILQSNIRALGTRGYLSTPTLISTVIGLGSIGYISTPSLVSTITGIGNFPQVISTLNGLGTFGYLSTASLVSSVNSLYTNPLVTDVTALLNAGYSNTNALYSNSYIYSLGGSNIASSSTFFEENGNVISCLPINISGTMYASTFKTIGYGSNYIYGDGSYLTISSDRRFKENIEEIPTAVALEQVLSLRGVSYNKIGNQKQYIGCIAQEVERVFPEVITIHPSFDPPNLKSMKYDFLTSPLLQSIKELIYIHSTLKDISVKNQGNIH